MRRSASETIRNLEMRVARLEKRANRSASQLSLPFSDSSEVRIVRNSSNEIRVHVKKELAKEIYDQVRIAQKDFKRQIVRSRGLYLIDDAYIETAMYSDVVLAKFDKQRPPKVDPRVDFLDGLCRKYLTCELIPQSRQGKEWAVIHCTFNKDVILKALKEYQIDRHKDDQGQEYHAGHYEFTFEHIAYKRHKPSLDRLFDDLVYNVEAVFDDYFVSGPKGYFNLSNNITDAYRLASRR